MIVIYLKVIKIIMKIYYLLEYMIKIDKKH